MAYARIKPRRGTSEQWTTVNPILAEGEIAIETPNEGVGTGLVKIKIGDGVRAWNDLPYAIDDSIDLDDFVVQTLDGDETDKVPSVSAVKSIIEMIGIRYIKGDPDVIRILGDDGEWHDFATGGLSYKALIPTLTSYTGNNGSCVYSSELSTSYRIWYAFDYGDSTVGATANATTNYIGYEWNNNIKVKGVEAGFAFLHGESKTITFKLQYLNGSDWVDIADSEKTHTFSTQNSSMQLNWSLPDYIETKGIRIHSTCSTGHAVGYYNIQAYGKEVV